MNLALRVLGRRADGFHLLESVMVAVSYYDSVELRVSTGTAGSRVHCHTHGPVRVPSGRGNLAWKAAVAVLDELDVRARVSIRIDKQIPTQAGLGGGSSDAAAVLCHLPRLLGRRIAHERLASLALALGADVPFFLRCRPSLVTGIGEKIEPLEGFARLHLAVVVPPVGVDTAWAYAHALPEQATLPVGEDGRPARRRVLSSGGLRLSREKLLSRFSNDFEAGVAERFADVVRVRARLRALGASHTVLSGSGSAVVGVFERAAHARAATGAFREGDRTFAASVLSGRPSVRRI